MDLLLSKPIHLFLLALTALATAGRAADQAPGAASAELQSYQLRGYRGIRHSTEQLGAGDDAVTLHRFTLDDAEHAGWFVSKLYSDFALTSGNSVTPLPTAQGTVDAIELGGQGVIAPVMVAGANEVAVVVGRNAKAVGAQVAPLTKAAPLRQSELTHPLYLDKWDRYCLGAWAKLADHTEDSLRKDPNDFFQWMGRIGLNPQIFTNSTMEDLVPNDAPIEWLRGYFHKYGVKYQRVEWLANTLDIYNRNPFLTKTANPHVATRWIYYGEPHDGPGPLHDIQNANFLPELRRLADDPNQMAILDPDGEMGTPFDFSTWGASGPVSQREFTRFLREVRKLSLDDVSRRYFGKPGIYKSWEDVTFPDWRTFYGWTDQSLDLAGEWRFQRDEKGEGFNHGWALPAFADEGWVRLYYPGDALVYAMASPDHPLWMRKTVAVAPERFPGKVYLSLAPLSQSSVSVFVNGKLLGSLNPNPHTPNTYGQFDITELVVKGHSITVALRFTAGDAPNGPIFLTSKPLEDFPTSDPQVNARRWDLTEFIDWDAAQGVNSTLAAIRTVEADRPIKVHAYGRSPYGWKSIAEYGGYSHHTGSNPSWAYIEPHQYALARDLQDSSETGSSVDNLHELKGLFGNLIYMGKNAFDYFHDLMNITKDPEERAWFEQKLPAIKLMGRAYATASPIAEIGGYHNWYYLNEGAKWESWRFNVDPVRGGEMIPFLDEVRIAEGNLNRYPVIIDPGTQCWDETTTAALKAYVEAGGILVLNSLSGENSFLARGNEAGPGATLAGVHLGPAPSKDDEIHYPTDSSAEHVIKRFSPRFGVPSRRLDPEAGVEVKCAWPDGSPAFTGRKLGKGEVYFFGGSTYPAEVLTELAANYGPKVFTTYDKGGGVDLVRTLRSNNGCEDLLMLRGVGNKPAVVHWTFDYVPQGIYDPVSGAAIPATIEGQTGTFTVNIPDWDFAWFAVRRPDAGAAFAHWFTRQTQMWSGTAAGQAPPPVPLFRHLDLNHGWKIAQTDSVEKAQALRPLDDHAAGLQPTELIPWSTPGTNLKTGMVGYYRKDFDLPAPWTKDSSLTLKFRGQMYFGHPMSYWVGRSTIYLNGESIWEGDRLDLAALDVTRLLRPAHNRLEIIHQGDGMMASIVLERSAIADSKIDLAGDWRAVDSQNAEREVTLPSAVKTGFVYRDVLVPETVRGQDVWLRVDGTCNFAIINGRVRYWDLEKAFLHAESPVCEIDITPDIRPGQMNRIVLGHDRLFRGWPTQDLHYQHVELAIYRPGKWSFEGKSNRDALTPGELQHVAQDLGIVQLFPMIHEGADAGAFVAVDTNVSAPTIPAPVLDLDLHPTGAAVADKGPNHLPVAVAGSVASFGDDANRAATGVAIDSKNGTPGGLSVSSPVLSKALKGPSFTIRTWLWTPPRKAEGHASGMLVACNPFRWMINDDSSTIWLGNPTSRKLIASNVYKPGMWQSVTLVVDQLHATLYVDAIPVAVQIWGGPNESSSELLTIGNNAMKSDFLTAKLGAFTVYDNALSDEQIVAQYAQERGRFEADAPVHKP
jgi:hypothetical protein